MTPELNLLVHDHHIGSTFPASPFCKHLVVLSHYAFAVLLFSSLKHTRFSRPNLQVDKENNAVAEAQKELIASYNVSVTITALL